MMIGERNHSHPMVHVPPWSFQDDPTADNSVLFGLNSPSGNANNINSPNFDDYPLSALQRYLPSNLNDAVSDETGEFLDLPVDAYSCDHFRMYEFKVRKCTRGRSHDWTECPYAHSGEKARRRDPRKYHYSGTACPEFRKGSCRKGDACEFAHGVFECWLHPARYRTQPCKDGSSCKRRVCFFAHSPEQLRVLSPRGESYGGGVFSPRRVAFEGCCEKKLHFMSSPESSSPPSESPPLSPMTANSMLSRSVGSGSMNELVASMRHLQLNKIKSMPSSWGLQVGCSSGVGSPRLPMTRTGFCSLPSTPTRAVKRPGIGYFDGCEEEEEPVMERVESGRGLRAKMFEKLSKENPLDPVGPTSSDAPNPDFGWVSDLIK